MGFEIDFIGIPEETKDADAIALRWEDQGKTTTIGIYDGGNQKYGCCCSTRCYGRPR